MRYALVSLVADLSTNGHQAISGHLRLHIEEEHAEDGICERRNCHTNMYALTAEVKALVFCC